MTGECRDWDVYLPIEYLGVLINPGNRWLINRFNNGVMKEVHKIKYPQKLNRYNPLTDWPLNIWILPSNELQGKSDHNSDFLKKS